MRPGDRIRLDYMTDDPDPIPVGTEGVIGNVHELAGYKQVSVSWECDPPRSLALVIPPDRVTVIGHGEVPEPWRTLHEAKERSDG
jgi:hypothetical protein